MGEFGYAGQILKVDLSTRKSTPVSTSEYASRFVGGRGIAAKIYWDSLSTGAGAFDADNPLIFMTGPLTGISGLASSRWQICGKSPSVDPESFSYANLGGGWGVYLKQAGYDGVIVDNISDRPVYLLIKGGHVEVKDAAVIWGKTAFEACETLKSHFGKKVGVAAIGPAGENRVSFATITADDGSSGSSGFGAVMGSKMLKAVVVSGNNDLNAADRERVRILSTHVNRLKRDSWGGYSPPASLRLTPAPCYRCKGCFRRSYQAKNGRRYKYFCQAASVYKAPALKYYKGLNEVPLVAMRLCDEYGLDTAVMEPMLNWLSKCYEQGILEESETDLPLSEIGSADFIGILVKKIAYREGFGDLLARGMIKAASSLGKEARELLGQFISTRANETSDYDPRLIITNALLYATEPRRPIQQLHEVGHTLKKWVEWINREKEAFLSSELFRIIAENFWGNEAAADLSSYDGKALAAKEIQDRAYAKECLILCDIFWPIKWVKYSEDHIGDPTLESQIFSAVTGQDVGEKSLRRLGERIFNLQRAILLREGWDGREGDTLLEDLHKEPLQTVLFDPECLVPGPDGKPISRRGEVVHRDKFERMKSEYYALRGWDMESGFPTRKKLVELELEDMADELNERGLLR